MTGESNSLQDNCNSLEENLNSLQGNSFSLEGVYLSIGLLLDGVPVHTSTAIYTPSLDLDGSFGVKVKVDARLLRELNGKGAFRGSLDNAENIGKPGDELVAMWNQAHPTDPVAP